MAITYMTSMDHYGTDVANYFFNSTTDLGWEWENGVLIGDGWLSDPGQAGSNNIRPRGALKIEAPAWGARQGDYALVADQFRCEDVVTGGFTYSSIGNESMRMSVPGGAATLTQLHFAFSCSDLPAQSRAHGQILHFMDAAPAAPTESVNFRLVVDASGRLLILDGAPYQIKSSGSPAVVLPDILAATAGPVIEAQQWYSINMAVTANETTDSMGATIYTYDVDVYIGAISPASLVLSVAGLEVTYGGPNDIVGWLPASMVANDGETSEHVQDQTQRAVRDIVFTDTTGAYNTGLLGQVFVSAQAMRAEDDEGDNWTAYPREKIGAGILDHTTNQTGVRFADAASLAIGAADFTIETLARFNTLPGGSETQTLISKWREAAGARSYRLYYDGASGNLVWEISTDGTNEITVKSVPWTPITDRWYAIAVVRSSSQTLFFIDGVQLGVPIADANTYYNGSAYLGVGVQFDSGGAPDTAGRFDGWLDETRFTNGVARYTSDYVPATSAFGRDSGADPDFASVVLLMGYDNSPVADESTYNRSPTFGSPAVTATFPDDKDFSFEVLNQRPPWDDTYIEASLVAAEGVFTFEAIPTSGETMTLGSETYTYVNAFSTVATNEILIGADIDETITNTIAAVNGGAGEGTIYGTGTTANADIAALTFLSPQFKVQAQTPGAAGNSLATTETMANGYFDDVTLTGGQDIPGPSDFAIERLPLSTTGVLGVQMTARAYKTDAGGATIDFDFVGPGGAVASGGAQSVDLSPAWKRQVFEEDPDTAAGLTPSSIIGGRARFDRSS